MKSDLPAMGGKRKAFMTKNQPMRDNFGQFWSVKSIWTMVFVKYMDDHQRCKRQMIRLMKACIKYHYVKSFKVQLKCMFRIFWKFSLNAPWYLRNISAWEKPFSES